MPINPRIANVYSVTLSPRDPVPLIRGWNRLEGRPRSADFERSLRAEVRDPVWFLTRQWQFGEFEGEDAGSPIDARLAYASTLLDTFEVAGKASAYDAGVPLETRVEAEPAGRSTSCCTCKLHASSSACCRSAAAERACRIMSCTLRSTMPLSPAPMRARRARSSTQAVPFSLTPARWHCGRARWHARRPSTPDLAGMGSGGDRPARGRPATRCVVWYERVYAPAPGAPSAWTRTASTMSSCVRRGRVYLCASVHSKCSAAAILDWHAFDAVLSMATLPAHSERQPLSWHFRSFPLRSGSQGMPSPRYLEMADAKTSSGPPRRQHERPRQAPAGRVHAALLERLVRAPARAPGRKLHPHRGSARHRRVRRPDARPRG